jgi:hypothetical protein
MNQFLLITEIIYLCGTSHIDQQIDVFIEKWLLEAFGDFFKDLMKACHHEPEAGYIPVVV